MIQKKPNKNPCNFNMDQYVEKMVKVMRPILKKKLAATKSSFVNTREIDDIILSDLKDDQSKIDGKRRWVEVHRSIRMRIITTTLIRELGCKMWSGKTRKVLCKPETGFKKASELKKK